MMRRITGLWIVVLMMAAQTAWAMQGEGTPPRGEASEFGLQWRVGLSLDHAPSSPRFYGMGAQSELSVTYGARTAVGVRAESIGMLGFGLTDDISVGARGLGGVLLKGEWVAVNPGTSLNRIRQDRLQVVLGLSTGFYRIGTVSGSVSRDVSEERHDGVSAMAIGGRSFGIAPQVGLQRDRVRVSLISHWLFHSEASTEPLIGLEASIRLL